MTMFDFLPVYKRELKAYFQSPSTYVVMALFFLITGSIFSFIMSDFSRMSAQAQQMGFMGQMSEAPNVTEAVIRQIFHLMASLILFTMPVLAMRLVAEEKSQGTFELLVTCPIGDWSILMGKFFALVSVGLALALLSALFPLIVWWAGRPTGVSPEWPVVVSCWAGLVMIFAAYGSFGLMASALSTNQMTAAFVTLIGLILWNLLEVFAQLVQAVQTQQPMLMKIRDIAGETLLNLQAYSHTENFINGVFVLKDFLFFGLASFFFLFIASKILDARRWRI